MEGAHRRVCFNRNGKRGTDKGGKMKKNIHYKWAVLFSYKYPAPALIFLGLENLYGWDTLSDSGLFWMMHLFPPQLCMENKKEEGG